MSDSEESRNLTSFAVCFDGRILDQFLSIGFKRIMVCYL